MKERVELDGGATTGGEPFREPLNPYGEGFPSWFKGLENYPEKIIRTVRHQDIDEEELCEDHGDMEKIIFTAKRLFEELKTKYNIDVAVDFVLAGEKDYPAGYAIVDKIHGKNLLAATNHADREANREKILEEVSRLLISLAHYFVDKLKNGKLFLWDIATPRQYIYGKQKGDTEDKIYLVDVDPFYLSAETHGSENRITDSISAFFDFFVGMELDFKTTLEDVRAEIKKAWADVPIEKRKKFYDLEARIGAL